MFQLNHPNVVRVYNYFDYREHKTSYIIMELVSGPDILEFLSKTPANADKIFEGVVDAFVHLQERKILHRDIRPMNILVGENNVPKIINFGFEKRIEFDEGQNEKSISLNWWCDVPPEFQDKIYDFQTEVYFVGKLFQKAVEDCNLTDFKYMSLLRVMTEPDRDTRAKSFSDIQQSIIERKFSELAFSGSEVEAYREFSSGIANIVSSIQSDAKFERDISKLIGRLEALYRSTMLEEHLAAPNKLVVIFISGSFKYWKNADLSVSSLRNFLDLLKGLSEEKRSIVVENFIMRLEAVERTTPPSFNLDDDVPF